jgi:hypothetical protein
VNSLGSQSNSSRPSRGVKVTTTRFEATIRTEGDRSDSSRHDSRREGLCDIDCGLRDGEVVKEDCWLCVDWIGTRHLGSKIWCVVR